MGQVDQIRELYAELGSTVDGAGVRVLQVMQPVDGGVPAHVLAMATQLRECGIDVAVASPKAPAISRKLAAIEVKHFEWRAQRSPAKLLPEVVRLARVVSLFDPDVIHLHSSKAGLAGRMAIRGRRPTVYSPHAWSFTGQSRIDLPSLVWERLASRWTTRFVCVSRDERVVGASVIPGGSWAIATNEVDMPTSVVTARGTAESGPRPIGPPRVVCVGRICRQKGQLSLASIWWAVREMVPGATITFFGAGPDLLELSEIARASPGIIVAGHSDRAIAEMEEADVVTMPSRWEAMAYTALEASAVGKPLVAFDVAGMSELADNPAVHLVEPNDWDGLTRSIGRVLLEVLETSDPSIDGGMRQRSTGQSAGGGPGLGAFATLQEKGRE
jgi:glycosyltransferase involved in cell wall biosynthesis